MNYAAMFGIAVIVIALVVFFGTCQSAGRRKDSRFKGWPFNQEEE
jgi:uncharacterized membrane protein YfcA